MVQTSIPAAEPALKGGLDGRLRALWRRAAHVAPEHLKAWAKTEIAGLGLWSPVAIGAGAGFYFGLKTEPHWMLGAGALVAALVVTLRVSRLRRVSAGLALAALGFTAADFRTAYVEAPALSRELTIRPVSGKLLSIEESARARRLVIALDAIEGVAPEALPARARVTWRGAEFEASPGDRITLRAGLSPPPPPAAPGGFDFARRLYFQKIGAVGFAVSPPVVDAADPGTETRYIADAIEKARTALKRRIIDVTGNEGGAIVAAVVTGKRDGVSEESEAALRDAGLAHLLAISGLHMGLATGLIFFTVRLGLAAIEPLALRFPIKKWAAAAALLSGLFYLILSGSSWSARRAFIMAAIFFAAILVDRRALSLRNVAIAATIILLTTPEALFHPGFQMSFAAVTALIAGYEWWTARVSERRSHTLGARVRRYAAGLAATDTLAAVATAPFALYHFNRVAIYSLPANMAAMPLMGFWIMPAAIVALLLSPFGLDAWAWRLSAGGMEAILTIAREVSSLRGAVSLTPQWPLVMLLAMTIGGLWLCLLRSPLRLLGLAALPLALLIAQFVHAPQIFVAASGRNAGVVPPGAEATLYVYSKRRDKFSAGVWAEVSGFDPGATALNAMAEAGRCDPDGCVMELPESRVAAFVEAPAALAEDCARADLVVAFFPASAADWKACKAKLIDRRSVWRRGAHAIRFDKNGAPQVTTVGDFRGRRPWTGGEDFFPAE